MAEHLIAVGPACTAEVRGSTITYLAAPDMHNLFYEVVALPSGVGAGAVLGLAVSLGLITIRTKDRLHLWSVNVKKWTVAAPLLPEEVKQ